MTRKILGLVVFLITSISIFGANIKEKTVAYYTHKDGKALYMDIYQKPINTTQPVMVFMFGGAFMAGERNEERYKMYFRALAEQGITVATIDYRLGLREGGMPSLWDLRPIENAINMAIEDLFHATTYLVDNASKYKINPKIVIASGSSAGAIAVVQGDYYISSENELAKSILPASFKYAGVVSFSGGMYSSKGKPKYKNAPAPTLFFHGDKDEVVRYNKLKIFNRGFFGPKFLTEKIFDKNDYKYQFLSFAGKGHKVSEILKKKEMVDEVIKFINKYVLENKGEKIKSYYDDGVEEPKSKRIKKGEVDIKAFEEFMKKEGQKVD